MGALVGGEKTNTQQVIKYSDLQVSTSQLDIPITLFWGQRRISPNCIWYNNFQAHNISQGKGGGKQKEYDYTAAVILALGEGVMSEPLNVWGPSSTTATTTLTALGLGFTAGTATQTPWSYVTANWPAQAQSYMDTAYVYSSNMALGESASVPDYGFEMQRLVGFTNTLTAAGWTNPYNNVNTPGTDCSFADIIPDFLTNTIYGMGFGSGDLADMTAFTQYQSAQGLYFSPNLTAQEKATDIIDRWAQLANSWIYWNGTQVQFLPLGDSAISGNGCSYTPDLAPAYALQLSDFIGDVPVEVDRQDPADCYNRTVLEICDRSRGYVSNPVEYKDQYLVAKYGLRDDSSTQADEICNPAVGAIAVQLIGKRAAYIRNTYRFKTSYRYILLLPGSIVTLTEPNIGLSSFPVRIRTVDEDDNGVLSFLAEELPAGIGTYFPINGPPATVASTINTNGDPGSVNTPAICEPASTFAGQSVALIAASGGTNWGGANVFLSLDGTDFSQIGTLSVPALQGTLTASLAAYSGANPDTTDTLSLNVAEMGGSFPSVSHVNAQNATSLCWIAPQPSASGGDEVLSSAGELLAFGAVATTGTYTANLSYLERGLYGTSGIAHNIGDQFTLFDTTGKTGSTLQYALPSQYIGKTLYLKFQSFNVFGQGVQDLSTCTSYAFTPTGSSFGGGTGGVPSEPTGLSAAGGNGQIAVAWAANPAPDNVSSYTLYAASGLSQPFSSAAAIWHGNALSYTLSGIGNSASYTFFLVANNAIGASANTTGVNGTSNSSGVATGSVTSVAMTGDGRVFNATVSGSPITGAGTLAPALLSQSAHTVLAGPSSGAAAQPSFRTLADTEIAATIAGAIPYNSGGNLTESATLAFASESLQVGDAIGATGARVSIGYLPATGASGTSESLLLVAKTAFPSSSTHVGLDFVVADNGTNNPSSLIGFSGVAEKIAAGTVGLAVGGQGVAEASGASAIVTEAIGLQGVINAASSGSVGTGIAISASSPSLTTSGTITTAYGVYIASQKVSSSVGTGWGLYGTGASDSNAIAGALAVGSLTAPSQALTVTGNANASGVVTQGYSRVVPTTGFSQTVANNVSALVLKPAGTLASGTITMPASPLDGQELVIASSQTITALTLAGNTGQTVNGAATTLSANTSIQYKWVATDSTWYRLR